MTDQKFAKNLYKKTKPLLEKGSEGGYFAAQIKGDCLFATDGKGMMKKEVGATYQEGHYIPFKNNIYKLDQSSVEEMKHPQLSALWAVTVNPQHMADCVTSRFTLKELTEICVEKSEPHPKGVEVISIKNLFPLLESEEQIPTAFVKHVILHGSKKKVCTIRRLNGFNSMKPIHFEREDGEEFFVLPIRG